MLLLGPFFLNGETAKKKSKVPLYFTYSHKNRPFFLSLLRRRNPPPSSSLPAQGHSISQTNSITFYNFSINSPPFLGGGGGTYFAFSRGPLPPFSAAAAAAAASNQKTLFLPSVLGRVHGSPKKRNHFEKWDNKLIHPQST